MSKKVSGIQNMEMTQVVTFKPSQGGFWIVSMTRFGQLISR
jgi:hypothetical protein